MTASSGRRWADRVESAVTARGHLCAGVDPHPALLEAWGLPVSVDGLEKFSDICAAAFADVAVVKPQVAFFEAFGSAGFAVLERLVAGLRASGALVVSDAKRGDIRTTADAYARAWLDPGSTLASDAVTASPYLGVDALTSTVDLAAAHGCGVFVLARTSNAEGERLQTAMTEAGASVAQAVVDAACAHNERVDDGVVGLVIGATRGHGLDLQNFSGPILAPGLGAQGGSVSDLTAIFGDHRKMLLPNSSRDILRHGPSVAALRDAAARLRDDIDAALT